ncbi:MAG: hypothetical protein L0Z62_09760 [Gemmataceae bacterium]|nr:hypothetical protein [Gemmataceae bacterium]
MRRAQVVMYEHDGRLTALLRGRAEANGWWLREVHHAGSCLRLVQRGSGVLVLRAGRDLERELLLLERVARLAPDTAVVVVGDADSAALIGLAWDLGARHVLLPPQPREQLLELVESLMRPTDAPPEVSG